MSNAYTRDSDRADAPCAAKPQPPAWRPPPPEPPRALVLGRHCGTQTAAAPSAEALAAAAAAPPGGCSGRQACNKRKTTVVANGPLQRVQQLLSCGDVSSTQWALLHLPCQGRCDDESAAVAMDLPTRNPAPNRRCGNMSLSLPPCRTHTVKPGSQRRWRLGRHWRLRRGRRREMERLKRRSRSARHRRQCSPSAAADETSTNLSFCDLVPLQPNRCTIVLRF